LPELDNLIKDATAGDPISGLKWTHKSLRKIADALARKGHSLSVPTVSRLLYLRSYSLKVNHKRVAGKQSPGRDEQFHYIEQRRTWFLRRMERACYFVDTDPQGSATSGCGSEEGSEGVYHLEDVLVGQCRTREAIRPSRTKGLFVIPAGDGLSSVEGGLAPHYSTLRDALHPIISEYDFLIIDTPTMLGLLLFNALVCASLVLVPAQCEFYGLQGVEQMHRTLEQLKTSMNVTPQMRVLMTMYDARLSLALEVSTRLEECFGDALFKTRIARNIALAEAANHRLSIVAYADTSKGMVDYMDLAHEINHLYTL
jgi:chromosome partitioning protein